MALTAQGGAFNGEEVMDIIEFFEVKEEIFDDVELNQLYEKAADPKKENVEPSCTCSKTFPIVYTTRLDDMNIFKKEFSSLPSSSIINNVIFESKPKFTKCIVKTEKNDKSNLQFMKLLNKLQQYNYKTSPLINSHALGKFCEHCCKSNRQSVSSSNNDPSIKIGSKSNHMVPKMPSNRAISLWQQFLTSTDSNNANGFVSKALKYAGKSQLQATVKITNPPCLPYFVLNVKSKTYKTQHCIVREDCQVQSYFETSRSKPQKSFNMLSALKNSHLKNHTRYVCCWVKHQEILSHFPASADLLKKIHNCPTGNCKCCCKRKMKLPPLKFKQIKLPETFNHTKRYITKLKEVLRNVEKLRNITMDQCKLTCKAYANNSNMPSVLSSPDQQKIESIMHQNPTVNTMISSIMHRFKHIKLSLSAEGKVQAILDTPATTFSKLELNILSKILEHAQEQVKDLGIVDNSNNNLSDPLNVRNLNFSVDSFHQRCTSEVTNSSEVHTSNTEFPNHVKSNSDPVLIKNNDSLNEKPKNNRKIINLDNVGKSIQNTSDLYDTYRNFSIIQMQQLHHSFESYFRQRHPTRVQVNHGVNNLPLGNHAIMPSIAKVFSLNTEVGTQTDVNKTKPNAKRSSETISILEDILTEKKAKLDIPSTSYQANYTTDITSGTLLQQKNNPITLKVIPSNPTSAMTKQPDYQYVKLEPNTLVYPVLIPVLTGNTDSVASSVPQNRSLLQTMITPVVGSESLQIPQSHVPFGPLDNTVDNDGECILGV
ncbi:hypothetical protein evm_003623 [Chilo suppressalis]|nr:hypothetical protein evm_003623 [Chilo suppressalis]